MSAGFSGWVGPILFGLWGKDLLAAATDSGLVSSGSASSARLLWRPEGIASTTCHVVDQGVEAVYLLIDPVSQRWVER